jgi:hypothetical protein
MENWAIALFIFGAVAIGMIGQGWMSFLDHQRRTQTLELIKAMLAAGKDPPKQLYDQLAQGNQPKAPWSEVVIFTALSVGFWLAFIYSDAGGRRTAFFVIAASMTVTAVGCLILALTRPGGGSLTRHDDQQ